MAQAKAAPAKKASPKAAPKAIKPKGKSTTPKVKRKKPIAQGVGRRKASVARVWVRPGSGNLIINDIDYKKYFDTEITQLAATVPFRLIPSTSGYDVTVNVQGGGKWGQADAVKLGVSRALVSIDEALRPKLRENGLLTVDSRVKERKKYGQPSARAKFQFVKR